MLKRLLSLNLALIMILLLLPTNITTAQAAGDVGYANFAANDGSGEVVKKEIHQFGSEGSLNLYAVMPEFKRDGYALTGYNSKADGTGKTYLSTQMLYDVFSTSSDNIPTLYAQWKPVAEPYVLFRATTTLTPSGKDYYLIENITSGSVILPGPDTFSSGDMKSVLWCVGNDKFFPGESMPVTGSMIVYVRMGVKAIEFFCRDGDGSEYSRIDTFYSTSSRIGQKGNYMKELFVGWNSMRDGTGDWYTSNSYAKDAPNRLYSQYTPYPRESYYILSASSGLLSGKEAEVVSLSSNAALPTHVKAGEVAYWYGSISNQYHYFAPNSIPQVPSNTTLYPVVGSNSQYAILVDGNGGTLKSGSSYYGLTCRKTASSPGQLTIDNIQGSNLGMFTKPNYALIGFKNAVNGITYSFSDSLTQAITATAGKTAQFSAVYTAVTGNYVQYIGNGAKTADGKDYVIQDGLNFANANAGSYLANTFVHPDGKKFIGWKDSSGKWYDPGDAITAGTDQVLYAQWGAARIIYDGTSGGYGVSHEVYTSPISFVSPSKSYSSSLFAGWNSKADGTGTYYTGGRMIPIPQDYPVVTVYAQWEKYPENGYYYIISANALPSGKLNEVVPMASDTETITLPSAIDGSSPLYGWYTSLKFSGDSAFVDELPSLYAPGTTMTVQHKQRVRALTDLSNYQTITYNGNGATTASGSETRTEMLFSSFSNLHVYDVDEVFDNMPLGAEFAGWNTKADGTGTAYTVGTSTYKTLTLYAQWKNVGELVKDKFGVLRFYVDGKAQTDYTGLVRHTDGNYYYVENGIVNQKYTGLIFYGNSFYYIECGILNLNYTGLVNFADAFYYVENGVLNQNYTGLVYFADTFYYVENGVLNQNYTGLVYFADVFYYVEGGVLKLDYTGLVYCGSEFYYVENGILNFGYTGLVYCGSEFYYVENGILNFGYTGLVYCGSEFYYVENGVLNFGYTGLVYCGSEFYYVENGVLNFGYTGLVYCGDAFYYVENGVLNFGYTGLVYCGDAFYYVENGVLNFGYTGLVYCGSEFYYVENGILNFDYTGLVYFADVFYYVENGVLNFGYTGQVLFYGVYYNVVGGILVP